MRVKYLSVCSGIEAASVAWEPLGWKPVGFSEIEPFPSAVLAHRFPGVPNLGDMTRYKEWNLEPGSIDVLVGGTPCQSFSVAGLRKGLHDPRGGLMFSYIGIAERLRPRWIVWENVPGVLSSGGGRDFGSFLGALGELGYGWAYRVLDAQWVRVDGYEQAVPQRRRRVFVVGCLGDWRRAAAVLFERESVQRDPAPRRAQGKGSAADAEACAQAGLRETVGSSWAVAFTDAGQGQRIRTVDESSETLRATKRGPFTDYYQATTDDETWVDGSGLGIPSPPAVARAMTVRRLTPRECERLQGFPDDWTLIPWRGRLADQCPDGPRYKTLGNSMAVNCMRWVGRRIEQCG